MTHEPKELHRAETSLSLEEDCAVCEGRALGHHEQAYFSQPEFEVHVAVTEALIFARRCHEAMRRAALHVDGLQAAVEIGAALRRVARLQQKINNLGVCIARNGITR